MTYTPDQRLRPKDPTRARYGWEPVTIVKVVPGQVLVRTDSGEEVWTKRDWLEEFMEPEP